ncbi:MAG: hypothetical protein NTY46_15025 [Candidatus Sumerlaeota bacterium]|nr:hypothetical protein [Candidatus Sumerlaeota bacterium]
MANEDIEIRITKTGEIIVKIEEATGHRLRDYHAFLEETIGPVTSMTPVNRPDWEKPAELAEHEEEKQEHQQQIGS